MCMHIISVRCLSTSIATSIAIANCSRAFLFFPYFTLSPSSLYSLFFPSFPSYLIPSFLSCPLPYPSSFHSTPHSFPTPPFFLTSHFPPISSSLIPLLLSFRSFFSLLASFPSNPLFIFYSSINPTISLFYLFIFSYPPPIPSYILPLYFFLLLHSFLSLLPLILLFSFLSLLLFIPFFSSYPSFPCSPPSLPLPHFFPPPPPFFLCCCCCQPTTSCLLLIGGSSFLPLSPSFPPLLPFLPLHSFLPYIHFFLPLLSFFTSFISSPSVICYLCFYSYLSFTFTSHFSPTSPSFSSSLSSPTFHSLIIPFAFFTPPSFALLYYLSPYCSLPPSPLSLSLSYPPSHPLSHPPSHPPSHPT